VQMIKFERPLLTSTVKYTCLPPPEKTLKHTRFINNWILWGIGKHNLHIILSVCPNLCLVWLCVNGYYQ
jgi:hypothetical protein